MNCVLFIDYENIAISLGQTRQLAVSPAQLARMFRENAEKHGPVKMAMAFANWDRFTGAASAFAQERIEPRFVLSGKNSADMELSLQMQQLLSEGDDSISTYILATGDRDFLAIVDRLRREGKRVVVWGVEERTSERLRGSADEFVPIRTLLSAGAPPSVVAPLDEAPGNGAGRGALGTHDQSAWTVPALAALILKFDLLMHERGWTWMAFKTLAEDLADDTTFGQSPAERSWWVNLAVSEGILATEKRPHARNPDAEITACSLNMDHVLVIAALAIVPRVIEELREQLYSKPWVAYGLLDRILAADPVLNSESIDRRFWINTLIHMGAVLTEKRENPNYPDRPVTGCRLDPHHPLVRRFRSGPQNPDVWLDYHLILCVEHFLCTKEVPWMSMGQLRRIVETRYGADKMRRAVERAVDAAVLLVEHYPNRLNPDRPTAGCRLNPDHGLVQRIHSTLQHLVRLLAQQLSYRSWAPIASLEKAMSFHRQFGETEEERQAWLALLMEPGIVLVDKRPDPTDPEYPTIACRLNFADRYVQVALSDEEPATAVPGRPSANGDDLAEPDPGPLGPLPIMPSVPFQTVAEAAEPAEG